MATPEKDNCDIKMFVQKPLNKGHLCIKRCSSKVSEILSVEVFLQLFAEFWGRRNVYSYTVVGWYLVQYKEVHC